MLEEMLAARGRWPTHRASLYSIDDKLAELPRGCVVVVELRFLKVLLMRMLAARIRPKFAFHERGEC